MTHKLTLPKFLSNEGVGDWSGLKGSDYHILVATYLMLCHARNVSFYAGNDLHSVTPAECPPLESSLIGMSLPSRDEWFQIKNVAEPWTVNRLLRDDTLILTFVLNALWSRYQGHDWAVRLVTTADVRSAEIKKFLMSFKGQRDARKTNEYKYYFAILCRIRAAWSAWAKSQGHNNPVTLSQIDKLAKEVLNQISECETMPLSFLTLHIENELLKQYPDEATVHRIALAIKGAISAVGEAIAAQPMTFTLVGLEEQTGCPLTLRSLVPRDLPQACQRQVARSLPADWNAATYVSRADVAAAFEEFRNSERPLFVLVGDSGSGKSWECFAEAAERLQGRVRLLISGSQLSQGRSLLDLVHAELADMARPTITPEELFRCLNGAAADPARGPLVLIADDVPLSDDPAAFEAALESLCKEAQRRGVKLVISVRTGVWQRLAQGSHLAPYLFRRAVPPEKPPQYSCELGRLNDDEMRVMLTHLLPVSADVERIALMLRRAAFAALRNPYLLKIYAEQHLADDQRKTLVPVDVDVLLDTQADARFEEVGRRVNCEPDDIAKVRNILVAEMWRARRAGKPSGALARSLEDAVAGAGRKILHALQSQDFLTNNEDIKAPKGAVVYANPQLGDRMAAQWLAIRMQNDEDIVAEMEPGLDDGVMAALVRRADNLVTPDAVTWAEGILERDPRWLSSLAQGLAQRRGEDWRVPATLTAWANRKEPYSAWNAMRALGDMTGHSSYARAWIAALYADEAEAQAFKGQIALGASLHIAPSWAKRCIILRLRRELLRPSGFTMSSENKEQARRLRGALQPLQTAGHTEASAAARSLLIWFQSRYVPPRDPEHLDVRESLGNVVDAIRGRVALFGTEAELAALTAELGSEDIWIRRSAACALLPVAEGRPDAIKEAVFRQARADPSIMGDVPRLLYFYTESDPEAVAEAVRAGGMLHTRACGIALTLLARVAWTYPQIAGGLLPDQLSDFPEYARGLLNELLAFAWWQYASQVPQDTNARRILTELSIPKYGDVEDKYRAFVTYGASAAVLARIGLEIEGMSAAAAEAPIIFHHLALETDANFLYVQTQEPCGRFAEQIATHPLFAEWYNLLCQTAREYAAHEIHPTEATSEWQFRLANLATDWLCACAPYADGLEALVSALPPNWPLLRFSTALIHAGRITPEIIERACRICSGNINVEGNISGDRDRFLYALREAGLLPSDYARLLADRSLWAEARLSSLEADIQHAPNVLLETLHASIISENAVPMLWEWGSDATDWRSVLLGNVLRSMFLPATLSLRDCQRICEQVLTAMSGLPDSRLVREYQAVYTTLTAFCDTGAVEVPSVEFENDLLSQSHRMAMEVVRSFQRNSPLSDARKFEELIFRGEGWVHDPRHQLQNGRIVRGYGAVASTLYFPPALRIALALASLHSKQTEFIAGWAREQKAVQELLASGSCKNVMAGWHLHLTEEERVELLASALREVDAQMAVTPRNARLAATKGNILVQLGQLNQAQEVLKTTVTLPWYDAQVLAGARYDLACCYARQGETEKCRIELQQALPGLPHTGRKHVENDPDFAAVHREQWFVDLASALPAFP